MTRLERFIVPYVTVKMLEGRSEEQKKALVEKVTASVSETTGASEEKIVVFIEEMSKNHYAVAGKRLIDQE
ncbi:2-hydroxymuconate tautomerase [Bacillus nitroreducens]